MENAGTTRPTTVQGTPALSLVDISSFVMEHLPESTSVLRLPKRETLPNTYGFDNYIVLVKSGWVALNFRQVAVCLLREGDVFLESAWPIEAKASERKITLSAVTACELLLVERAAFLGAVAQRPDLLFSLFAYACRRNLEMSMHAARHKSESLENQLAFFLWDVGTPTPEGNRIVPNLNQTVLADCLSTRREEITRKRNVLADQGLMFKVGRDWVLSAKVGEAARAAGYGRDALF